MKAYSPLPLVLGLCLAPLAGLAQEAAIAPLPGMVSPYAGMESREIKSLSEEDIATLEAGEGWGLALPAELNGVPGPAHVLELAEELELSDEQVAAIEAIHERMSRAAIAVGAQYIQAEAMIEEAFRRGPMPPQALQQMIIRAEQLRARLRFIHLSAHLETPYILTPEQIDTYRTLRGYDVPDPCASVPEGHDAEMWRAHNGCPSPEASE